MSASAIKPLIFLIICLCLYFMAIVYLSKIKRFYFGLTLPIIAACVATYNLLKPILVYNPYPTMAEGFYMVFYGLLSIIGFIVFGCIRYNENLKSHYIK